MTYATMATSELSGENLYDHFLARIGYRRGDHRVTPALYYIGNPTPESPVFVSANYTLSFDALRISLNGTDCYILVLDTKGINVWCAAGKGTFGTDELVRKIESTNLRDVVTHRKVILPQLGAPGVAAHEVKKRTGFSVEYGPVRAADLPEYLLTHQATEEMRRVRFPLKDRAILVPVEIKNNLLWGSALIILSYFLLGLWPALMVLTILVAGLVLLPLLLPILPTNEFASKGIILGAVAGMLWGTSHFYLENWTLDLMAVGYILAGILLISPWVGFLSLNFTGCSTYTSRTGVKKEIFRFIPIMAVMFTAGAVLMIALGIMDVVGW